MDGHFSWRLPCVHCKGLTQGWGGGDLKDSEVVSHIDFSLSDPLAGGRPSFKVSNLAVSESNQEMYIMPFPALIRAEEIHYGGIRAPRGSFWSLL